MRYPADQKENTRQRVLIEALQVLREGGPSRLGVNDVMKRAGLTHGAFYVHFESRDDLLMATLETLFATTRTIMARLTGDPDPASGLRAFVDWYLSAEHRDAQNTGCPLALLVSDVPRLDPAPRERYAAAVAHLVAAVADRLRDLGRPDPNAAAAGALQQMVGAVGLARALGSTAPSDDMLRLAKTAVYAHLGLDEGGRT